MAGNSWLGVAQWVTAAEQPPSLKCIAPFEGASDIYREIICRGGIPYSAFFEWVAGTLRGEAARPRSFKYSLWLNSFRPQPAGGHCRNDRKVSSDE